MSKEPAVAEAVKKPDLKPEPKLARASESGDAAVQNLLSARQIHLDNGDTDKAADVDKQLNELGYE